MPPTVTARLRKALGGVRRIILDTGVYLMASDSSDRRQPCAAWLLDEIARGRFECTISTISVAELLTGAVQQGAVKAVAVQSLLRRYPHLTIEPVSLDIAADAAELRAATRLRLPDALIIATASVTGLEAVLHGDRDWTRRAAPHVGGLRLLDLGEYCV